jgi:hypothetical protein
MKKLQWKNLIKRQHRLPLLGVTMTKAKLENIKLIFSQMNPYDSDWTVTDDSYDCDWDSEIGFYAISPQGTGATKEEALIDYLNQLEDLTEQEIEEFFNRYK